jgi:hypothetical protein
MTPRLRRSNIVLAGGLALFIGGIYSYTYSKMKTVSAAWGRKSSGARTFDASHGCKMDRSTCNNWQARLLPGPTRGEELGSSSAVASASYW